MTLINTNELRNDYKVQTVGKPAISFTELKNEVITAKGYMNYFGVSLRTAQRWLTRDRQQLGLNVSQKLLMSHFLKLYGTPLTYSQ